MARGRAVIVAVSLALSGCYWTSASGPDLEEQAEEELNCDHVEVRRVASSSSRSCRSGDYIVEGCGTINHYRCIADSFCEYDCRLLGSNELRSN